MLTIPTISDQVATNIANIESFVNQTTPTNSKAFNIVIATMEALQFYTLYKYAENRAKQNFALSAKGAALDFIGSEYGADRKKKEACNLTIELPAITGTLIPSTNAFIGVANGVRYTIDSSVTSVGGIATISITASELGIVGNLEVGDSLRIETQLAGAETVALVTVVNTVGAEDELDDVYRVRILDIIRAIGGGGNNADYRIWAQEVPGVKRAYPYSGAPIPLATEPPDRTVYVECDVSIEPDGIAPPALLAEVRTSIETDPDTGYDRQPLGLTNATLYVEAITRTSFDVEITDLTVDVSLETQVKADILDALEKYFRSLSPFITGLDFDDERNDYITAPSIVDVIQEIVANYGGSFTGLSFEITGSGTPEVSYLLGQGETSKLGAVTYV